MLIKILFTLLVIVGVLLFFRNKSEIRAKPDTEKTTKASATRSLSTRTISYLMLAVLIAISALIFVLNHHDENRIVNIRVITDSGTLTDYQARHKTIKGRQFETLDGKRITLGESDRIEMVTP